MGRERKPPAAHRIRAYRLNLGGKRFTGLLRSIGPWALDHILDSIPSLVRRQVPPQPQRTTPSASKCALSSSLTVSSLPHHGVHRCQRGHTAWRAVL